MRELIQRAVGPAIRLETVLPDTACVTLCDTNQLESALLNLAINARDAMPQGGQLTIEVALPAPGDHVVISVSDSGTGMTPDTVARAFDPFFTTKPLGQGTGLGLSMVYGFIKQSGGNVTIDSQPGHGTTIRLSLPHYRGAVEMGGEARETGKPAAMPRAERTATVLVLDDEPEVRKTTAEMLQELGYTAIPVESCDACLAILQAPEPIDLLITDVGLPGDMDGWMLADKARTIRPDLKVLFITGYTQNGVVQGPPRPHAGEILTKPFAMDAFAQKVRNIIASEQPASCSS
jgi:CheY-like chemotaxis protein